MDYSYDEYIKARKENLFKIINEQLLTLNKDVESEDLLYTIFDEYQEFLSEEILTLYKSVGLDIDLYDIFSCVYKVQDAVIRRKILKLFEELHLIFSAVNRFCVDYMQAQEIHKTINDILYGIADDKKQEIQNMIEQYKKLYNEKVVFIGKGQNNNVFSVGNKIIKFGAIRRYEKIPYCLEVEQVIQYSRYHYAYVTEKIESNCCTYEDARNMYFALRNQGYVWLDVKEDNLGIKNGEIKILDDIDIFSVDDIFKMGKYSVLDFVSTNLSTALLEIEWISRQTPDFDIDSINVYFNDKNKTELIERLKDEYVIRGLKYQYDAPKENCLFLRLLKKRIN